MPPQDDHSQTTDDADFVRGVAAALGALIRTYDQPGMAADIMQGLGLSVDDLRQADVLAFDRDPIERAMRHAG